MYSESTSIALHRTSPVVGMEDIQVDLIGVDLVPAHIVKSSSASIHGIDAGKPRHR
jgi:hypothetical protein